MTSEGGTEIAIRDNSKVVLKDPVLKVGISLTDLTWLPGGTGSSYSIPKILDLALNYQQHTEP